MSKNNCLHEIIFEDAPEQAGELDEYYVRSGRTIGPLNGLPVSLKDQIHVTNAETTVGYDGWLDTFEGRKNTGREF